MDPLDDLVAALRADWQELDEEPKPLDAELSRADSGTQAAVRWMQRAFDSVDPESVPAMPPELLRRDARRRGRRRLVRPLLAAAAATIAALALWRTLDGATAGRSPQEPAQRGAAPSVAEAPEPPRALPIPPLDLEPLRAASRLTEFEPDAIEPRADGVEIVTGNVRIILLDRDD